jgi:cardiolipin synthase
MMTAFPRPTALAPASLMSWAMLPNVLTVSRLMLAPVIVASLAMEESISPYIPFSLFTFAVATDFLDGWLARAGNWQSSFGRIFDPVADKALICGTLLALAAQGQLAGLLLCPALIIVWREFLVSGLREFVAEEHGRLSVTPLAKWKTAVQSGAVAMLLAAPLLPGASERVGFLGGLLLWLAGALSLYTGLDYGKAAWRIARHER